MMLILSTSSFFESLMIAGGLLEDLYPITNEIPSLTIDENELL